MSEGTNFAATHTHTYSTLIQSCSHISLPSPRRAGFNSGPVHVGFVVDKLTMKQDWPRVLRRFALSIIPPKLRPRVSFTYIRRCIILWRDSNVKDNITLSLSLSLCLPPLWEKNLWQLSKMTGRQALCSRQTQSFFYSQINSSLLWGPPVSWVLGADFPGMKRQAGGLQLIASPPWRTSATSLPIILPVYVYTAWEKTAVAVPEC